MNSLLRLRKTRNLNQKPHAVVVSPKGDKGGTSSSIQFPFTDSNKENTNT
jgi:hypothetical protein